MTGPLDPEPARRLSAGLAALFGVHKGALADAGRALGCDRGDLSKMLRGKRNVPARLLDEIDRRRALQDVQGPPPGLWVEADRDEPCGEALDPHLDALAARAEAAGWHPAEVVAAVLSWVVRRAADGADVGAARELLAGADEALASRERCP